MPPSAKKQKTETGNIESTFCPYSDTSNNYDKTRVPLGVGCTMGSFAMSPWPLPEQRLIDVGGGTGTFVEIVMDKFKDATLFEANGGMLKQAHARLGKKVACTKGSADDLSCYKANTFHAATMNQVIHHFPIDNNYEFLGKVLKQIFKVLKPGGAFVLNHCSTEQHQKGYWWYHFMPKACKEYCIKSPPMPIVLEKMREAGFIVDDSETYVPLDGILMRDEYMKYGLEGAFKKDYRDGDSGWTMGEMTGELEGAQKKIRQLQKAGKEKALIEQLEAQRKSVGQSTFVTARKPLK